MAERSTATLRRRELGRALREMRLNQGMTIEQVAEALLCSTTKISRIETAARAVSVRDVRDLCRLYESTDETYDTLVELTRESRQVSWWQRYDIPYKTFIGLEQSAATISEYNTNFVPGLLQTADYALALIADISMGSDPKMVQERVSARLERQQILDQSDPPYIWVILDEMTLTRPVGSYSVLADQAAWLIELSRRPNVHLQIIPRSAGIYPGFGFPFTIHDFEAPDADSVVYVEGLIGDLYLERKSDVESFRHTFNEMRSYGRGPRESRVILGDIASSLVPDRYPPEEEL